MAQLYFINIEDLKDESLIHDNVETKTLRVILKRCQRHHLTKMLGVALYDELLPLADSGGGNAIQKELFEDWLNPFLIIKVEEMAALNFNIEIRNKSVGTSNDEYQTAADMQTIDKFKNDLVKQSQFYKTGMVDFIKSNLSTFPLYPSDCSEVEKAGDSHSYVFSSVVNRR